VKVDLASQLIMSTASQTARINTLKDNNQENFMKSIKIVCLLVALTACTEDQQNQLARKAVEYLDGNYQVTYANGSTAKTWIVRNGKVTSNNTKGYYFFWDEKKHYIQTPIENTFIEEID
jgi:hypothetical protein